MGTNDSDLGREVAEYLLYIRKILHNLCLRRSGVDFFHRVDRSECRPTGC